MINTEDAIKLQIHKLRYDGNDDLVWDLHDWLEYNQDKTSQLIKNITRQKYNHSSKEQYIVILMEKILEEFTEPFFGYFRVEVTIRKMNLINEKLDVNDQIKFYFWINVAGITNMSDQKTGNISSIFKDYKYVQVNPKTVNGFKLMNDEKEMMKLMLPTIKNQGEAGMFR